MAGGPPLPAHPAGLLALAVAGLVVGVAAATTSTSKVTIIVSVSTEHQVQHAAGHGAGENQTVVDKVQLTVGLQQCQPLTSDQSLPLKQLTDGGQMTWVACFGIDIVCFGRLRLGLVLLLFTVHFFRHYHHLQLLGGDRFLATVVSWSLMFTTSITTITFFFFNSSSRSFAMFDQLLALASSIRRIASFAVACLEEKKKK
ncbi:hypothetical protein TYRP_022216 [Tyrophagus putrescentiae]|nr:hypothetical protein TYRP_022216 [Tyrophagus putrescentiae]